MIERFKNIFDRIRPCTWSLYLIKNGDGKKSGTSFNLHTVHTEEMWKSHLEGTKFEVKTIKLGQADSLGIMSNKKMTALVCGVHRYRSR